MATFTVSRRAERGEKPKHLRKKGYIPLSITDRAHETHLVKAPLVALQEAVRGVDSHGVIELQIEGESGVRKAILKSIDGDPIAHHVHCATFLEVAEDDKIKTEVAVVAKGHSDDTDRADVILTAVTTELKIRAKVSDIPESIEVDVSSLHPGENISAGQIELPAGVELLSSPDAVLFTVAQIAEPNLEVEDAEASTEDTTEASADSAEVPADES